MNVFVDAARVVFSIGSLGEQFKGAGSSSYSGEYLASSVTSMGADAVAGGLASYKMIQQYRLGSVMTDPEELKAMNKRMAEGTSVILKTLAVVDGFELLTGFGPPCAGDDFTAGSQQLTEIYEQLKSTLPDDHWQGRASDAYAEQVEALRTIAQKMAEIDSQLSSITKDQADWITHIRLGFGLLKDLLMVAFAIEMAMRLSPAVGMAVALSFANGVSMLAMGVATGFLGTLVYYSWENSCKANDLLSQCEQLGRNEVLTDATSAAVAETKVVAVAGSTVSGFQAISQRLSAAAAGADFTPTTSVASDDASAQASRDWHVAGVPDETAPSAPAFGAPSMASVPQMSGQAAQVGQPAAPIRQAGRRPQRVAGIAEETALVDEVDATAAAGGPDGAERAPIEFAAVGGTPMYSRS